MTACATNPVTGKRELSFMSEAQEISVGRELDAQVRQEMGLYENDELQRYVQELGMRLARSSQRPNLPWSFAVLDSPAVNAFALPGGFIYITRGILPYLDNEAQLVGVLGHEIGHVTARHSAQQYTRGMGASLGVLVGSIFVPQIRPFGDLAQGSIGVLFLKFGRDDELQADALGAEYTAGGRMGSRRGARSSSRRSRGLRRRRIATACRTGCRRIRSPRTARRASPRR